MIGGRRPLNNRGAGVVLNLARRAAAATAWGREIEQD